MAIFIVAVLVLAVVTFLMVKSGKVKDDNNNGIPDAIEAPVVKVVEEVKEVETRFNKYYHHKTVMTNDFKARCGIKRMKKNDALDYPEPIKLPQRLIN